MAEGFERVLVTGATGFIGRALVRRLLADGHRVSCTSRRPVDEPPQGTDWLVGDVGDHGFVDDAVRRTRPEVVFHLASQVTGSRSLDVVLPVMTSTLDGSINVLKSVTDAGCDRLVLIGSGDEPENGDAPCSPYAAAKWAVRSYARMFHRLYGTPVATARPFMVYGPDQPDTSKVVPYVTTALLRGDGPTLSSGRRLCDWIYIDDVVDALLTIATAPLAIDRVVDVGTGTLHSVRHVVESIAALVGGPASPVFGGMADRQDETEAVADIATTHRLCGWSPTTELANGLADTVAWYRAAEAGRIALDA